MLTPPSTTKEIYGYYCDEQRRLHKDDPSSLREALVSPTYFNKVWAAHLPKVKIKVRGDFMLCETCTRLKGLLHGEPGQRPVQDKAARQRYQSEYDQHIKVCLFVVLFVAETRHDVK